MVHGGSLPCEAVVDLVDFVAKQEIVSRALAPASVISGSETSKHELPSLSMETTGHRTICGRKPFLAALFAPARRGYINATRRWRFRCRATSACAAANMPAWLLILRATQGNSLQGSAGWLQLAFFFAPTTERRCQVQQG